MDNSYVNNSYEENGVTIDMTYFDAIQNSAIGGSYLARGRVAKNTTNSPVMIIGPIDITDKTITGITFKTQGPNTITEAFASSTDGTNYTNHLTFALTSTSTVEQKTVSNLEITGSELYLKWSGSVSSSTSSNRDFDVDDVVVTYIEASNPAVATTTTINVPSGFNNDLHNGTNAGTLTATVKDNDDNAISGATVIWESSNTGVATIDANGEVTLVAVGTTTITASYAGVEGEYRPSSDTYELTVIDNTPLANIAALTSQTVAGNYNVALSNAVVTYVNGNYAYIQDASGAVVMYKSGHGLTAGNVLNGTATVAYQLRNNNPQITNLEGVTPTSGEAPDPTTLAASSWNYTFNNVLSQYFKITGATITSSNNRYYISLGGENVQLYGQGDAYNFSITNLSATYTIIGFPTLYNSTNELQIFVIPTVESSTTPTVTINDADLSILAVGEDGIIEVSYENIDENDIDPEAQFFAEDGTTSASYDWITISFDADNDILYHIAANSGGARTAYFKVYEQSEGVYSNLVTVTQNAYVPTPAGGNYVRISSLDQLTDGSIVVIAARHNSTANSYYALPSTATFPTRPEGVQFNSTTTGGNELLPSTMEAYYWVVNVTDNGYTFTTPDGKTLGCRSDQTNLYTEVPKDVYWTIERLTSGNSAMVSGYEGFVIRNTVTTSKGFAFNGSVFGAYSYSANSNNNSYNFYLDFFVQDEQYTKDIAGWDHAEEGVSNFYLIASPIGDVNPADVTIISREDENVIPADVTTMVSGSYDLYYFDHNRDKEWVNYIDASNTPGAFNTLESGKGYLYANLYDVTLVFRGTGRHSGEETIELDYVSGTGIDLPGWNLLGNPFAKTAYLTTSNSGITTSFYTMDERGNYISVTNGSIDPMEGVFVHAEGEGQSVTFTTTAPSKSPVLNLNLSNGRRVVDRAIVRFDRGNQLPKLQFRQGSTKVYIPVEGQDYAVVSCEEMGELPVSFKAEENGSYNLSLSSEEVSFAYLHLIDNMTGADVDLLQTPSYSFEARTTDYANRFKLVFATGDNSNDDNFAFFSNGSFVINNDGEATLQVIDVTGRILSSESINGCTNVNVNAASGVYMLRLINGDNVKVQKVVVK